VILRPRPVSDSLPAYCPEVIERRGYGAVPLPGVFPLSPN